MKKIGQNKILKYKSEKKILKKIPKNFPILFFFFASKSRNCEELTKLVSESKSRNREDHEL